MTQIREIDYLLRLDEQGVIVYEDDNALGNQLNEWFDTPQTSIYGKPSWGHELNQFKHEPPNEDLQVSVENVIIKGILRDLPHIRISAIVATTPTIDSYSITMNTQFGLFERSI